MSAKAKGGTLWPPPLAGAGSEPILLRLVHSFHHPVRILPAEPETPPQRRAHADGHAPEGSTSGLLPALLPHLLTAGITGQLAPCGAAASPGWASGSPTPAPSTTTGRRLERPSTKLAATGINNPLSECLGGERRSTSSRLCTDRAGPASRPMLVEPDLSTSPAAGPIAGAMKGDPLVSNYGLNGAGRCEVVRRHPEWLLRPQADGKHRYAMHGANLKTSPLKGSRVWLNHAHPGVAGPVQNRPLIGKSCSDATWMASSST